MKARRVNDGRPLRAFVVARVLLIPIIIWQAYSDSVSAWHIMWCCGPNHPETGFQGQIVRVNANGIGYGYER